LKCEGCFVDGTVAEDLANGTVAEDLADGTA